MFHPSEVELGETTRAHAGRGRAAEARRVVVRLAVGDAPAGADPLRYRRQMLALKQYFAGRHCTVLLLDDRTAERGDLQLHSIAHGVISLEQLLPRLRRRARGACGS